MGVFGVLSNPESPHPQETTDNWLESGSDERIYYCVSLVSRIFTYSYWYVIFVLLIIAAWDLLNTSGEHSKIETGPKFSFGG